MKLDPVRTNVTLNLLHVTTQMHTINCLSRGNDVKLQKGINNYDFSAYFESKIRQLF